MSMQSSSHPALSCADQLAADTSDFFLLVGRILLGWIFVRSGYGKLFDIAACRRDVSRRAAFRPGWPISRCRPNSSAASRSCSASPPATSRW